MCETLQLSLALLLLGASARAAAPANPRFTGTPFLRTWAAEDYNAAPGNQCVIQHPRNGYIYVGNNLGVLEFDGAHWRLLHVPGGTTVRALAVDGRGWVWAANNNQIWRLQPDGRGELHAVSMRDRLPPAERNFRYAFALLTGPAGVFAAAGGRVFYFADDGGSTRVWTIPDESAPEHLWWDGRLLHVQAGSGRVYVLRGDRMQPDPAATAFTAAFGAVHPRGDDGVLCATTLADGQLALGTALDGLVIRDRDGREVRRIGRARGLPSNRVEGLCEDREGGVWLALRNGLARAQLDSPYALHGAAAGFDGTPTHLELYHDSLYVSGTEGLARRGEDGRFIFLENLLHVARELVVCDGQLYVTGRDLQLVLPGDRATVLDPHVYDGFLPLRSAPGYFVHGAQNGLWLVQRAGEKWQSVGRCNQDTNAFHALIEEPAGIVWALAQPGGLRRLDFRTGSTTEVPEKKFGAAEGLPEGLTENNFQLFPLGAGLDALAKGRLLRFDATAGRFVPETRIAGLAARSAGESSDVEAGTGEASPMVAIVREDADRSVWLELGSPTRRVCHLVLDGPEHWRAESPAGPSLRHLLATVMLAEPSTHTLWLGGPGTLVSQDLDWRPGRPPAPLAARLRRVELADGTLLWADGAAEGEPPARLRLQAEQRALHFVFAAPAFAADHASRIHTVFRTRLDGLGSDWTKWTGTTTRDFTNLPYRDFVFQVQARDDDGRTSAVASFPFAIDPPWWLTSWALTVEALIAIALVAAVARHFAARALRLRVQRLEAQAAVEAERLRLARDMHDDLGSGLGRVALLGSSALGKLDDRTAVETSFRKMIDTAQALSRATRDIIWAVSPQNDTVPELAAHLARLAEELLGEAGIRCAVDVAPDLPPVALGAAARHAALLAVKEAIHNAIKYSGASTAEFSARAEQGMLVVVLRDHGRGFAPGEQRGTGHGVKSIAWRLEAHGGSGEVTSMPGQGTTVRLKLPLRSA